jgi:hypothetical protein
MNSKFWLKLVKVRLGKSLWLMVEWGVEEGFFNGPNRRKGGYYDSPKFDKNKVCFGSLYVSKLKL